LVARLNPDSSKELGGWEAGKLRARLRMGRAESGAMGFAPFVTFLCLPDYSRLAMKAIPID